MARHSRFALPLFQEAVTEQALIEAVLPRVAREGALPKVAVGTAAQFLIMVYCHSLRLQNDTEDNSHIPMPGSNSAS